MSKGNTLGPGFGFGANVFPNSGPFLPGAAQNGVSVDPVSKAIVLGNNVGDFSAGLLNDREIPMNGHLITLTDALFSDFIQLGQNGIFIFNTFVNCGTRLLDNGTITLFGDSSTSNSATLVFTDQPTVTSWSQLNRSGDLITGIQSGILFIPYISLDDANIIAKVGDTDALFNNTNLIVDDAAQSITAQTDQTFFVKNSSGTPFFFINEGGAVASMGDVTGSIGPVTLLTANWGGQYCASFSPLGFGVNVVPAASPFAVAGLAAFANNAAAVGAGLVPGDFYRISVAGTSTVAVVE